MAKVEGHGLQKQVDEARNLPLFVWICGESGHLASYEVDISSLFIIFIHNVLLVLMYVNNLLVVFNRF